MTSAKMEDAGTISCLAKNGSGEAAFQVKSEIYFNFDGFSLLFLNVPFI